LKFGNLGKWIRNAQEVLKCGAVGGKKDGLVWAGKI
jgi:hypothetical protein